MEDERGTGHDTLRSASPARTFLDHVEHQSNSKSSTATVPGTVMAEQITNDVVKEAQSVGRPAPIDDTATTTKPSAASGEQPSDPTTANSKPFKAPSASSNTTTTNSTLGAGAQVSANSDEHTATVSGEESESWIPLKFTDF